MNLRTPPTDAAEPASRVAARVLSWGRYPQVTHRYVHKPAWDDQVPQVLAAAEPGSLLPFGVGCSYGDSCLNAGRDLARHDGEAGDTTEALATLRGIVDWFPASLDVPVLAECRARLL